VSDDVEQLRPVIPAFATELDELDRLGEQRATLGCAADTDPVARSQFEEAFVAEEPQGA
jgi:hypothetical protein